MYSWATISSNIFIFLALSKISVCVCFPLQLHDYDMCIARNEEALRLEPRFAECYGNMANAWKVITATQFHLFWGVDYSGLAYIANCSIWILFLSGKRWYWSRHSLLSSCHWGLCASVNLSLPLRYWFLSLKKYYCSCHFIFIWSL